MKNINFNVFNKAIITLFFLILPFTGSYAEKACCSHHGGSTGCNAATGFQQCKDGTTSPSCKCTTTTTPKTKATIPMNATGCCSGHGGIAKCKKSKGTQMCKDGTMSPSCKCN